MAARSTYLNGLDTLRAAAILLVLAYHYQVFVSHTDTFGVVSRIGWVGVDLFFALSPIGRCALRAFVVGSLCASRRFSASSLPLERRFGSAPPAVVAFDSSILKKVRSKDPHQHAIVRPDGKQFYVPSIFRLCVHGSVKTHRRS